MGSKFAQYGKFKEMLKIWEIKKVEPWYYKKKEKIQGKEFKMVEENMVLGGKLQRRLAFIKNNGRKTWKNTQLIEQNRRN